MMSEGTLDDRYLEWLYTKFGATRNRNPSRSYWHLAVQLYRKPFRFFIGNDENRALDGIELRYEFIHETGETEIDMTWMELECSFLEMLIALARRVAFETDGYPAAWFGKFLENLEIVRYTDDIYEVSIEEEINEVLDRVNQRTYSFEGVGGLFPLRNADRDQRVIEIWYQMSAYINEGAYVANGPLV